jgi:hypothetical protein
MVHGMSFNFFATRASDMVNCERSFFFFQVGERDFALMCKYEGGADFGWRGRRVARTSGGADVGWRGRRVARTSGGADVGWRGRRVARTSGHAKCGLRENMVRADVGSLYWTQRCTLH